MSADEGTAFIGDSRTYLPVLGVSQFGQGPGDMTVFVAFYEIILKINHMLLVDSYFGPQEDSGKMCILSVFTEDTDKIARTALEDTTVSDHQSYLLHTALRALLQAYLPTHAAKEWRRLCEELVWPPVFRAGRRKLFACTTIATLTAMDALHVNHLDVPS